MLPGTQEVGIAPDDREEVVEIVSDTAGQAADGLHLLRLSKLLFEPLAFGDDLVDADHADDLAETIAKRHLARQERGDDASGARLGFLQIDDRLAALHDLLIALAVERGVGPRYAEVVVGASHDLLGRLDTVVPGDLA